MFNIEIADLVITLDNKYPLLKEKCRKYLTEKENTSGIILSASIESMESSIDYKLNIDGEKITLPEAEYDAIHYPLYSEIHMFDAFWLHSVLLSKDGNGYAFTAAPGTGKTTHAKLWLQAFEDATIVNGDNTIIRQNKADGIFYGYGTPFCGKEGFSQNCKVPMKAICFLERSDQNYVERMNPLDAIMRLAKENWCLKRSLASKAMNIYLSLANQLKFYTVHCNMELEAAFAAYNEIK